MATRKVGCPLCRYDEVVAAGDYESHQRYQMALDGDRTSARLMWKQVAEGAWDLESIDWMVQIAKRVLAADQAKGSARANGMLKAVCLVGKLERRRDRRTHLEVLESFEDLTKPGTKLSRAQIEQDLERSGLGAGEAVDARSLLDRELQKVRGRKPRKSPRAG